MGTLTNGILFRIFGWEGTCSVFGVVFISDKRLYLVFKRTLKVELKITEKDQTQGE